MSHEKHKRFKLNLSSIQVLLNLRPLLESVNVLYIIGRFTPLSQNVVGVGRLNIPPVLFCYVSFWRVLKRHKQWCTWNILQCPNRNGQANDFAKSFMNDFEGSWTSKSNNTYWNSGFWAIQNIYVSFTGAFKIG